MVFQYQFILLTVLAFFSVCNPNKYSMVLVVFMCILPSSLSLTDFNAFNGINIFDGVLLGLIVGNIFRAARFRKVPVYSHDLTYLVILYAVYFLFSLVLGSDLKFLLKDLRPLLSIITFYLFVRTIVLKNDKPLSLSHLLVLVIIIDVFLLIKYGFHIFYTLQGLDVFYNENSYRYLDAGVYMSFVVLLYLVFYKRKEASWWTIGFLVIPILIANSRIILAALILATLFFMMYKRRYIDFIKMFFSSFFLVGVFIIFSLEVGAERISSAFNFEMLLSQIESRYSPAMRVIEGFDWYNYLLGGGLGIAFDIPWFSYRENVSSFNANIDSYWVTLYCKFGLLVFFVIWCSIKSLLIFPRAFNASLAFSILIIFVFSATFYQIYSGGLLCGVYLSWRIGLCAQNSLYHSKECVQAASTLLDPKGNSV